MQIEAGKYYVARDGGIIGPMRTEGSFFSFRGYHYAANGECCYKGRANEHSYSSRDLIEEWAEPTATPAPAGPVRMVRQIVPGVYGRIEADKLKDGQAQVRFVGRTGASFIDARSMAVMDADELRSAAMVFSQLAEALDDQP